DWREDGLPTRHAKEGRHAPRRIDRVRGDRRPDPVGRRRNAGPRPGAGRAAGPLLLLPLLLLPAQLLAAAVAAVAGAAGRAVPPAPGLHGLSPLSRAPLA